MHIQFYHDRDEEIDEWKHATNVPQVGDEVWSDKLGCILTVQRVHWTDQNNVLIYCQDSS